MAEIPINVYDNYTLYDDFADDDSLIVSDKNYDLNSVDYYDSISDIFKIHDSFQSCVYNTLEYTHEILSKCIISKDSRILDLGCGIGAFVKYLNEQGFKNTTGVVNNKKLYDISKERFGVNIIEDDMIKYMKNNKKSFDIIFNIESVGYVDINLYFKSAYSCLDNYGVVVLKDFTSYGDTYHHGKIWGNYTFYKHEEIITAAIANGFNVIKSQQMRNVNVEQMQNAMESIGHREMLNRNRFNRWGKLLFDYAFYIFEKNKKK